MDMDINRKIKVLIVDDEELICWSLKHSFEKDEEYAVCCAYTGSDALQKLNNNSYDVVLTDLNLPDVKDFDIVSQIKTVASGVPVFVMSAHLTDPFFEDVVTGNAYKCIAKPFEIDDVLGKVKEAVKYSTERNS